MPTTNWLQNLIKQFRNSLVGNSSLTPQPQAITLQPHAKTKAAGAVVFSVAVLSSAYAIQAGANNDNPKPASSQTNSSTSAQASTPDASNETGSGSAASSNVDVSTTTTTVNGQQSSEVSVNGKPVNVPTNGTTHQTTVNGNQRTDVSVSHSSNGGASNQSSANTQLRVYSHSTSQKDQDISNDN